jgi:hypothetical protein
LQLCPSWRALGNATLVIRAYFALRKRMSHFADDLCGINAKLLNKSLILCRHWATAVAILTQQRQAAMTLELLARRTNDGAIALGGDWPRQPPTAPGEYQDVLPSLNIAGSSRCRWRSL